MQKNLPCNLQSFSPLDLNTGREGMVAGYPHCDHLIITATSVFPEKTKSGFSFI